MSAQPGTVLHPPHRNARIARGASPDILTTIYEDDVNAAVWERPAVPLAAESGSIRNLFGLHLEASVPAGGVERWFAEQAPEGLEDLGNDIAELADMYACLFDVEYLGIRLKSLDKAMCPRFHVDRVACRLLTTYRGPGTEYLRHDDVDRGQLGQPVSDSRQLPTFRPDATVNSVPEGAVLLCKGESWPGNEGRGFVHRSPQPVATPRLMLCVDGLSRER